METRYLEDLQILVSLCKRRGFVFPSSEIYGGINACWDYGPLGAELKLNVKKVWWESMTRRADVVGLDAAILMAPMVWKASGHVDTFSDPMVDCKKCKLRFRADKIDLKNPPCKEKCGGEFLTEPRNFNLMFKTYMGPLEDASSIVYLRPETAQGIYVNFENVHTSMRKKVPFGIAQIGKAFRNEITPGNFTFRTREFEQMEMQFFVKPGADEKWMDYWKQARQDFYLSLGFRKENLRFHAHTEKELAHYAKSAFDIEFQFPMGWQELEGIHNRSDFDLSQHQKFSGKNLEYFEEATKEKFLPYIIETSAGCDRFVLAALCDSYRVEITETDGKKDERIVLGLHPQLAPVKAAVFPLSKKPELQELSEKIFGRLMKKWVCQYDESASIGKRYRRQDEIGTPLCITVDFDSLTDNKVTVRERDSMKQDRVSIDSLEAYMSDKLVDLANARAAATS
ncbi:MAG: glycine--tRNA ligase [Bdellovibrionales bacterium CG10_big_fil_rev_8_21_14_0_10_45_34]|nr:MAG: glycine--tRNA ligase [Bdellovibrionales bacterium CG10_big_fil_rev_8_21_14_0_10_45_34]